MLRKHTSLLCSALLLGLPLALASPHGSDASRHSDMGGMDMDMSMAQSSPSNFTTDPVPMSYFRLGKKATWIYGHIFVMTICWTVVLPLGVMFSIAKSRFTFPLQAVFFILNALGLFLGTVYNASTPDLYENNAHHKMGWIFTWLALAWVVMGIVNTYGKHMTDRHQSGQQVSHANLARYARLHEDSRTCDVRWSNDSGQGTERNSASLFGSSASPGTESENRNFDESLQEYNDVDLGDVPDEAEKRGFLRNTRVDRFLSQNIHRIAVGKTLVFNRALYTIVERTIILMGWAALATGVVTFSGIFRGNAVFNGLAHWIKGSIFFWFGLFTLGRWMGAFADFGWAWNIRPRANLVPAWKTRIPNADFVESFLIFLYGISNVWLEHLAAWGSAWAPEDYEHVSITILFGGGGLLGMLIESTRIRDLLSSNILITQEDQAQHAYSTEQDPKWTPPNHYTVSLNPLPGLVILLLGLMMSSHTQESMISSMVHKQWGTLLVGASLARGVTYILCYLKPQTSYLPARPPSELICAFCLMAGGVIFMASSRDVVMAMERNGLDAMFGFTVGMGVVAMVMAWAVLCMALKGWSERRERTRITNKPAVPSGVV